VVVAEDWMESGSPGSPGCPFTIGLLGALFEDVAGEPVAVLETACEGHGDEGCRFVFGSEAAVRELRKRLENGVSEEAALAGF
jgi:predicted hydrocarbon binding protein